MPKILISIAFYSLATLVTFPCACGKNAQIYAENHEGRKIEVFDHIDSENIEKIFTFPGRIT